MNNNFIDLKTVVEIIKGKKVNSIDKSNGDEGLILKFDDGSVLEVSYSFNYGSTTFNGKEIV